MDTKFLESLVLAVDHGSMAEAARRMNLTPAAIGQRIRALETDLGVNLLDRVGHRAVPTPACVQMMPRIRRIIKDALDLPGDSDRSGLTGSLRIGAISTVLTDVIPGILRLLQRNFPSIQPHIFPGTSQSLYDDLVAERLDAAIIVAPPFETPKFLTAVSISEQQLVFVAPKRPTKSIAVELETQPYLAYDPSSWGGQRIEAFRNSVGSSCQPFCVLDSLETIALLVNDDVGVSILPLWPGLRRYQESIYLSRPLPTEFSRSLTLLSPLLPRRPAMVEVLVNAIRTVETEHQIA